jgi:hypothetical protein
MKKEELTLCHMIDKYIDWNEKFIVVTQKKNRTIKVLFYVFFVYFSQPERIMHAIFIYIMHIRAYSCRTLRGHDVGTHYKSSSNSSFITFIMILTDARNPLNIRVFCYFFTIFIALF